MLSPRRRRNDEEQGTAPCKRGQVFQAASNTATIPSVDGLTWITLINISMISNKSPSGSGGYHMPLQLGFANVIFLLVRCFFLALPPPLFRGVCLMFVLFFLGCVRQINLLSLDSVGLT